MRGYGFAGRDHLAVLLDFDGTLAEIADRPDDVHLDPSLRGLLERLGHNPRILVGVISGRALEDIRRRVGLEHILYAGNHGLELAGPGWTLAHDDAVEARGLVAACCDRLSLRLRDVHGALVENKGLSASVHFRLVPRKNIETVRRIVLEELGRVPPGRLVAREGKMVLEILPMVDWDKGKTARWLLEHALGSGWEARCTVIYVGDDSTDEDAFVALADTGITIRVAPYPQPTAARYQVRTVGEVGRLLEALADWMTAPT
jgi:trehalose 6-phosphate phosphatase